MTFANETASGWQQQSLATPITLKPGRVYVLSYNINDYYVVTRDQLATILVGTSSSRHLERSVQLMQTPPLSADVLAAVAAVLADDRWRAPRG